MKIIFDNPIMLWFPAYYLLGECLSKSININDYSEWEDNDMDWENTETERINSMVVTFTKNEFKISNVILSHINKQRLANNPVDVEIDNIEKILLSKL